MSLTYAQLKQAIQDYTENTETTFVNNIDLFIRQVEQRVRRTVMIPELRKNATTALTPGNPYLARPSDFLSVFSLAVVDGSGNYSYLLDKDVNFIREAYPSASSSGLPKYYGQFDGDQFGQLTQGNFILGPAPDAAYTVELHYYYDPPSIVDSSTSWLGTNAESVLLYGCLAEAYTFMKGDPELLAQYEKRYQESLAQMNVLSIRGMRDEYRDGRLERFNEVPASQGR